MGRERTGSRKRTLVFWLGVLAAFVGAVVWWLWPERVRPFDESEVWTVDVEAPEPPEVVIPTVTIDVTDAPVSAVLAEMNRQAEVTLGADEATKANHVTLQVKDAPVLQAFAKVADLTGSGLNWREGVGLELVADGGYGEFADMSSVGPCLVGQFAVSSLGREPASRGFVVTRPPPLSWPVRGGCFVALVDRRQPTAGGVTEGYLSGLLQSKVTLTFGTPVEVAFDLKRDRGKRYRLGNEAVTYMGWEAHFEPMYWQWPLNRFLPDFQRRIGAAAWRVDKGYGHHWDSFFTDGAGLKLEYLGTDVLRLQKEADGGWEKAQVPPQGAKWLVVRVVPKTKVLTYPFPAFNEEATPTPKVGDGPPAP